MKVYEIGYSNAGQHIAALMQEDASLLLIDTRKTPYSRWHPQYNRKSLAQAYGERYRYAGDFLGNVNYKDRSKGIQIAQPEVGIGGLIRYLDEGHNLILMCACGTYATCHRKVIIDLLCEKVPDIDVVHAYRVRGVAAS